MKMKLPDVALQSRSKLMTDYGEFEMLGFIGQDPTSPIIVLVRGNPTEVEWPLVRLHSKCTTSETFGSLQCDCAEELEYSMRSIQAKEHGVIIYLDQEARGNGLAAKLQIYQRMQDDDLSSDEACESLGLPVDTRNYDEAVSILKKLGIEQVQLLTNNPDKIKALENWDIRVQREPIPVTETIYNSKYLLEKQRRHHHAIPLRNALAATSR